MIQEIDLNAGQITLPSQIELKKTLSIYIPRMEMNLSDLMGTAEAAEYTKTLREELVNSTPRKVPYLSVCPPMSKHYISYIAHQVVCELDPVNFVCL